MGKKAKTKKGAQRALNRRVDESIRPPPPPPLDEEIGSLALLPEPKVPGGKFKVLDTDKQGYDDGGVADLTLLIDLDDRVLRRKRGENDYFAAVKSNILPRVTNGQLAQLSRRDQKVQLATLLFSDGDVNADDDEDSDTPCEVYVDTTDQGDDDKKQRRMARLAKAKQSLKLSFYLSEPACAAMSLTEISKRTLLCYGKEGAEAAFRCAHKALQMAGNGYYDNDLILMEAEEEPKEPKYETNATYPGLSHPTSLKYIPARASMLCKRAAYLHAGNALHAQGKYAEAREYYEKTLPLLEPEPRSCRIDWERSAALINIGDTHSREDNYELASKYYDKAEQFGKDHLVVEDGNHTEGKGIVVVTKKARAAALKRAGKEEEAKSMWREVLTLSAEFAELMASDKTEMKKEIENGGANPAQGDVHVSENVIAA
ncbi:hypothetical protein MPSEU_000521000 [Mayamaea pseudoterrestris]|nr:hypothetical protein MPSEU_000521000 [Mayamaea pseudoterrestris]